ncbi:MAG: hypothetical protein EOP83_21410 [Verrucomicrobiaceae bacterium]|nr:MAG: hypothetical protein EOP83_21410 [Verrucomicrobiaceae bacterium]
MSTPIELAAIAWLAADDAYERAQQAAIDLACKGRAVSDAEGPQAVPQSHKDALEQAYAVNREAFIARGNALRALTSAIRAQTAEPKPEPLQAETV